MRWWRVFLDKLTGRGEEIAGPVGPRRRNAERFDVELAIEANCDSWGGFVSLMTGDVSATGLFVPTERAAAIGEPITVRLSLPEGIEFELKGAVVRIVDTTAAKAEGKRAGLGIHLDPLDAETKTRFDYLLNLARRAQPVPETLPPPAPTPAGSSTEAPSTPSSDPSDISQPGAAIQRSPAVRIRTSPDGPIVGIDLGTTYTHVAAVVGSRVTVLARAENGERSTPSVIAFPSRGQHIVGAAARERLTSDPSHTVVSPKRLLGRPYSDREVQTFVGQAAYRTMEGPDGSTVIELWQDQYAIPQLCAILLEDIKRVAEHTLGTPVRHAVASVPVSFDDNRIKAVRRAAEMAGIELVGVIDEPSAAALANRFTPNFGGIVGVYDFGGGTFDFSIVDVSGGDFKVMATSGDTWLGGDDFDTVLAEAVANQFWRQHKVDVRKQAVEWQRLLFACENAKRRLSTEDNALIEVPDVLRTADGMVGINIKLDRATLARASAAVTGRSLEVCKQALELVNLKPSDLSAVFLSGGTTYMPVVRDAVRDHFRVPILTGVPPEHAVCLGTAIHAAQIAHRRATTLASR